MRVGDPAGNQESSSGLSQVHFKFTIIGNVINSVLISTYFTVAMVTIVACQVHFKIMLAH